MSDRMICDRCGAWFDTAFGLITHYCPSSTAGDRRRHDLVDVAQAQPREERLAAEIRDLKDKLRGAEARAKAAEGRVAQAEALIGDIDRGIILPEGLQERIGAWLAGPGKEET